jgi:hypothetical protein
MSEKSTNEEEGAGATIGRNAAKTAAEPAAEAAGQTANLAATNVTEGAVTLALAATPLTPVAPLIGKIAGDMVGEKVERIVKEGVTNTAGELGAKVGGTFDNVANASPKPDTPKPHPTEAGADNKEPEEQPQSPKDNAGSDIGDLSKRFASLSNDFGRLQVEAERDKSIEQSQKMPNQSTGMNIAFNSSKTKNAVPAIKPEPPNLEDPNNALKAPTLKPR